MSKAINSLFSKALKQENADLQIKQDSMLKKNEGVPQNKNQAVMWYTWAIDQGDASAQLNLGYMYDKGEGVRQDKQLAVVWYTKAAEQGLALAQFILGYMYDKGIGVGRTSSKPSCGTQRLQNKEMPLPSIISE